MYTPKATVDAERKIRRAFLDAYPAHIPFAKGTALHMEIYAFFLHAKSNKTSEMTQKPDVDNCAKLVADALNEVAYADDCQITSIMVNKLWAVPGHYSPGFRIVISTV
jgi:Holliday junction resolvase RusA-like endonuclease